MVFCGGECVRKFLVLLSRQNKFAPCIVVAHYVTLSIGECTVYSDTNVIYKTTALPPRVIRRLYVFSYGFDLMDAVSFCRVILEPGGRLFPGICPNHDFS